MTVAQFLSSHGVDLSNVSFEQSKQNTYDETDTPISWLQLPVEVEHQDYLVLSATAASRILKGELKLRDCDAKYSAEAEAYGITCPKDVNTLDVKKYW